MVLVQTEQTCGAPGATRVWLTCSLDPSDRGLRRDTRGSYQGVGTSGGLAGFVLPLSKCLVHRDSLGYFGQS